MYLNYRESWKAMSNNWRDSDSNRGCCSHDAEYWLLYNHGWLWVKGYKLKRVKPVSCLKSRWGWVKCQLHQCYHCLTSVQTLTESLVTYYGIVGNNIGTWGLKTMGWTEKLKKTSTLTAILWPQQTLIGLSNLETRGQDYSLLSALYLFLLKKHGCI